MVTAEYNRQLASRWIFSFCFNDAGRLGKAHRLLLRYQNAY